MTVIVGGRSCVKGFDQSMYQPPRPLHAAVTEGFEFVVLKASEGYGYGDPAYLDHCRTVADADLVCGAYHFARPDTAAGSPYQDGRSEARWFLGLLQDDTAFVVLDLEASTVDAAATTQYVLGFWAEVIDSRRFPLREQRVLYVGAYFNWLHAAAVAETCVLWVPSYPVSYRDPDPTRIALPRWASDLWPEGWQLWQYSSNGTVAGHAPVDVNVATATWMNSIRRGRSAAHDPYDARWEMLMRPIMIEGESVQYELVVDGFGNRRRRAMGTLAEAELLAAAGVLAGQDQALVLNDPAQIEAFNAIAPVGLGGPPVLADMGALKLAVETWKRIEAIDPDAQEETDADDMVAAVHDLGDYLKRYEPTWQRTNGPASA